MITKISSPFQFVPVSGEFVAQLLAGAGITDLTIETFSQSSEGLEIVANRHLSPTEKETVRQVLLAFVISIQDS